MSEAGARRAYLVLGMHRSGTSALTQLLALAGADLPTNLMPGDEHNAKGYFEPWRIAMFNNERLRETGGAWDDPFAFPFRPLPPPVERAWIDRAKALVAEEFGAARHPLLKDPRITVLAPLWRDALAELGFSPRYVIPVRHPLAIAGSLARRDGFTPQKSVLLWTSYMLAAEAYSRGAPRALIGYDRLLADWRGEMARVEQALGEPFPASLSARAAEADAFLTPELRHNEGHEGLEGLGWTGELAAQVFDWFRRAAAGAAADGAELDGVAAALAARQAEMGALVSATTRDLDLVRDRARRAEEQLAWDVRRLERERGEERAILVAQIRERDEALTRLSGEAAAREQAWTSAAAQLDALLGE